MKMTSSCANKMIRKLKDDKDFYRRKEHDCCIYVASLDEEPVIPEYDYATVAGTIAKLDEQIAKIKHVLNVVNCTNTVLVEDEEITIDAVLVKMAQLSLRKDFLDKLRKMEPKTRVSAGGYATRKLAPEYQYINFDLELIKKEYEAVDARLCAMQIALDKFNQTFEFEVNL